MSDSIVASAEKAFLDVLYLYSLGRYYIDLKKINLEALSYNKLAEMRALSHSHSKTSWQAVWTGL